RVSERELIPIPRPLCGRGRECSSIEPTAFCLRPSVSFFSPPISPRPQCADNRYNGRGSRQAHGESRLPPASDSASEADVPQESFPECRNRIEAHGTPKKPLAADGDFLPGPTLRSS